MNDKDSLKYELARFAQSKDYKTFDTLLSRNPNSWKLNIHEINEEIAYNEKPFTKHNDVMKSETKPKR